MAISTLSAAGDLPSRLVHGPVAMQVVLVTIEAVHSLLEVNVGLDALKLTEIFSAGTRAVTKGAAILHRRTPEELMPSYQSTTDSFRQAYMTVSAGRVTTRAVRLPHGIEDIEIVLAAAQQKRVRHTAQARVQARLVSLHDLAVATATAFYRRLHSNMRQGPLFRGRIAAVASRTTDLSVECFLKLSADELAKEGGP